MSQTKIDTKEARLKHPSGWLHLTHHDSAPIIPVVSSFTISPRYEANMVENSYDRQYILIDALLDLPPRREFNKSEFAEHALPDRPSATTSISWSSLRSSNQYRTRVHPTTV
jgi:hypothetical protein